MSEELIYALNKQAYCLGISSHTQLQRDKTEFQSLQSLMDYLLFQYESIKEQTTLIHCMFMKACTFSDNNYFYYRARLPQIEKQLNKIYCNEQ